MASANDVLRVAAGEVGYSRWDDPEQGTKYGRWYAGITGTPYFGTNGVPYCAMFVSWVLNQVGQDCAGFPTASCTQAVNGARKSGRILSSKHDARAGDIVIFDWDPSKGNGVDHVGFVELNKGGYIQTIEGNTSSGNSGSQSNGGVVARRTRSWGVVSAIIRPDYKEEDMTPDQAKQLQAIYDEVTSTDDPTGRGVKMNDHDHIKWVAATVRELEEKISALDSKVGSIIEALDVKKDE